MSRSYKELDVLLTAAPLEGDTYKVLIEDSRSGEQKIINANNVVAVDQEPVPHRALVLIADPTKRTIRPVIVKVADGFNLKRIGVGNIDCLVIPAKE